MNLNNIQKLVQTGQFAEAKRYLKGLLVKNKANVNLLYLSAVVEAELGNMEEALQALTRILAMDAKHASAHYTKAILLNQLNRHAQALPHHDAAAGWMPSNPWVYINRGNAHAALGHFEQALLDFDRAIGLDPNIDVAYQNKGGALLEMNAFTQSLDCFEQALRLNPHNVQALSNKAACLIKLNQTAQALEIADRAIALRPDYAEAWNNRGLALSPLNRLHDALTSFGRAIELRPDYAQAWTNRGNALNELNRHQEALLCQDRAIELNPGFAEAWSNRGNTFNNLKNYQEALLSYDRALELSPNHAQAWSNRAIALNNLKRHGEAAQSYLKAAELVEADDFYLGKAHHQMMLECDWSEYETYVSRIETGLAQGQHTAEPFGLMGISDSEALHKTCAELFCQKHFPASAQTKISPKSSHPKIRLAYLCGEFRDQATSHLMTGVWESHDRDRFEVFALDSGWNDHSEYRSRIEKAIPNLIDISEMSDIEAAELIERNHIDVLVNLNGYFGRARQKVFSLKPAPIQVNYLGFPGTIGAAYMDYIIADRIVIPDASRIHYSEKVVHLPFSYQANDRHKKISETPISRHEFGLPENSFIYCCFNNNYKITPPSFRLWMEILSQVQDSCLWLLEDNPVAKENLRRQAQQFGVDPGRLIFAQRVPIPEHIHRHQLADLFLDTLPYNAHTTASDALWAGLPLLTLKGRTFPGRVAASLLSALNVPELIVETEEEFKTTAIHAAHDPQWLAQIKLKIGQNRLTAPLFDTPRMTGYLEQAYVAMHERFQAGQAPDHIRIDP